MNYTPTHRDWRLYQPRYRWDFTGLRTLDELTEQEAQHLYLYIHGKPYDTDNHKIEEYIHGQNKYVVKGHETALYLVAGYPNYVTGREGDSQLQLALGNPAVWSELLDMGFDLHGLAKSGLTPEDFQVDAWICETETTARVQECMAAAMRCWGAGCNPNATRIHWHDRPAQQTPGGPAHVITAGLMPRAVAMVGLPYDEEVHVVALSRDSGGWKLLNTGGATPLDESAMLKEFRSAVRDTAHNHPQL